jgi:polyferredoxin
MTTTEAPPAPGQGGGRAKKKRRLRLAAAAVVVILLVDALVLTLVVPWADEQFHNPFMSLGYIITFFLAFCNLVVLFALTAFVLHGESYPSDRWT